VSDRQSSQPLHHRQRDGTNDDGSIDILLRNKPLTKRDTNCLPTPLARFNLALRIYWPEQSVPNGPYAIPPVEQADTAP